MIEATAIIAVKNVRESALWYQKLLACRANHGGDEFEMLVDANDSDNHLLYLHLWDAHDHPSMLKAEANAGSGIILYFSVNRFKDAWENALALNANIDKEPCLNENSNRQEFSLLDPDGYYLIISEKIKKVE